MPGVPGGGGLGIIQLQGTHVRQAIHAHCCSGVRLGMAMAGAGGRGVTGSSLPGSAYTVGAKPIEAASVMTSAENQDLMWRSVARIR